MTHQLPPSSWEHYLYDQRQRSREEIASALETLRAYRNMGYPDRMDWRERRALNLLLDRLPQEMEL